MMYFKFLLLSLTLLINMHASADMSTSSPPYKHIDYILVEKAARTMKVFYKNKLLKTYKIALGGNPVGLKTQEGDQKTPEGIYKISWKNP